MVVDLKNLYEITTILLKYISDLRVQIIQPFFIGTSASIYLGRDVKSELQNLQSRIFQLVVGKNEHPC